MKARPVLSEVALQDGEVRFPELAANVGRAAHNCALQRLGKMVKAQDRRQGGARRGYVRQCTDPANPMTDRVCEEPEGEHAVNRIARERRMDTCSMPPWKERNVSTSVDYPETTQPGNDLVAHDTGLSPGVQAPAHDGPASVGVDTGQEQLRLMSALGICRDGRRYCFRNYCSVRLQDAVAYARLVARRELYASGRR